jgi:hypothetical protein
MAATVSGSSRRSSIHSRVASRPSPRAGGSARSTNLACPPARCGATTIRRTIVEVGHRAGAPPADGQRVAAALVVVADDLRRDRQVEGDDLARSQK